MTDPAFLQFILDHGIARFFEQPLQLKSGRQSHFYVNWRTASNDAFLLNQLSDFLIAFIAAQQLELQTLYGVPEGASKTALITAFKLASRSPQFKLGSHGLAMGRAKPKKHGDPADRFFIGQPQGPTYVLEDTVTTGLSLFQSLDQLFELGIDVRGVICLTDRCERRDDGLTIEATLQQRYRRDLAFLPLSRAPEIMRLAIAQQRPSATLVSALAAELGISPAELDPANHA